MATKKPKSKVVVHKHFNWKKLGLILFFLIGLGGYFSYFINPQTPEVNVVTASGLDPEEAAYLQQKITPQRTTVGTTTKPLVTIKPSTKVSVSNSQNKPVDNGIEADEAVYIQKVINKENTNSVGTAPAPVVSVTTKDENGVSYTANIILNKPTEKPSDNGGAPIPLKTQEIADQIKQEVINKATSVPPTATRLQKEVALMTPRWNDLTCESTNGCSLMSRALFCKSNGAQIPQGATFFDRSDNHCYRCGVFTAGGSREARTILLNRCPKTYARGDGIRDCILYQHVDKNKQPIQVFSMGRTTNDDIPTYFPADGKKITYSTGFGTESKRCYLKPIDNDNTKLQAVWR